ncbi:DUF551 domain-containing protein [Cronobacter sp. JZ38]|uniref:DUF551 domain-containing protein n=1 Tax=Cronobacter sp. JZ38 TaxID=1906275 RepID=UPI0015566FCC|nr:DUF551 domain-containing protein [Cronobacter sp. JZ38]
MSTISNVTRYRAGLDEDGIVCHREKEDGRWVKYEDYEQLEKELLALRKERERAEPVEHESHIRREVNVGGNTWVQCSTQAFEREKARGAICRVLYESPPAPGVPAAYEIDSNATDYHRGWNACRATMLQSGNDEIGSWSNHKNTPTDKPKSEMRQAAEQLVRDTTALAATLSAEADTTSHQFESLAWRTIGGSDGFECTPVADLYELLTKCGECYDYTTSAKVAADWIKEGYSAREYVKLDRLQEAMTQGSSGEDDGWIPCSERMPGIGEAVLMRISCNDHFNIESGKYKGDGMWLGCWFSTYGKKGSPYQVAHWMPIPAAPEPCK